MSTNMNQQKLIQIGDFLRANPLSYNQLAALNNADLNFLLASLLPNGSFTPEQRYWLNRWFLKTSVEQVSEMNALLTGSSKVSPLIHNGEAYLGVDLISDEVIYGPIQTMLKDLPFTYINPEDIQNATE